MNVLDTNLMPEMAIRGFVSYQNFIVTVEVAFPNTSSYSITLTSDSGATSSDTFAHTSPIDTYTFTAPSSTRWVVVTVSGGGYTVSDTAIMMDITTGNTAGLSASVRFTAMVSGVDDFYLNTGVTPVSGHVDPSYVPFNYGSVLGTSGSILHQGNGWYVNHMEGADLSSISVAYTGVYNLVYNNASLTVNTRFGTGTGPVTMQTLPSHHGWMIRVDNTAASSAMYYDFVVSLTGGIGATGLYVPYNDTVSASITGLVWQWFSCLTSTPPPLPSYQQSSAVCPSNAVGTPTQYIPENGVVGLEALNGNLPVLTVKQQHLASKPVTPVVGVIRIHLTFAAKVDDDVRVTVGGNVVSDNRICLSNYTPNTPHPPLDITAGNNGDYVQIDGFDGWASNYSLSAWSASVYLNGVLRQTATGGTTVPATSDGQSNHTGLSGANYYSIPRFFDYRSMGGFTIAVSGTGIISNIGGGEGGGDSQNGIAPIIEQWVPDPPLAVGLFVYYPVTAELSPTGYSATGLPDGLVIDPYSGIISGAPTTEGDYEIFIYVTNDFGTGSMLVVGTVLPSVLPAVDPITDTWTAGVPVSYMVTATNSPWHFDAITDDYYGLPDGLTIDDTGLISGTPTTSGTYTITIEAYNDYGSGSATTVMVIG